MDDACIYALIDPRDNRTYYVGLARNLARRLGSHISGAVGSNSPKDRWICELIDAGLLPAFKVLERLPYDEVGRRERWWIRHMLDQGEPLFNGASGGQLGGKKPARRKERIEQPGMVSNREFIAYINKIRKERGLD